MVNDQVKTIYKDKLQTFHKIFYSYVVKLSSKLFIIIV